ncbi:MAG: phage major tail protein, TP901-1 family [Nitrosopumilaceae archaeon]|nr:phage major tail protein, TP901-1 family [Nitrosopumilaceae archaeon]NIU87787.1 phage major tail protein, TP901-1 family [Nitrosopumilaceae archaeon]NIV65170.1 phage major tail protein, TP901-1 family [Nitrosopumilaceae archaeon]NIX61685.1 phage major tail protein, TP901-1 family [Nitrosopumilaceae archaeon]
MNGKDVLILVDTDGAGTFAAVASQTNASISETNALIDESSKDARERKVSAGRYEAVYSFESLFISSDAGFQALRAALRNGTKIKLREQESGVAKEEVNAVITDMSREFPDQDNVTISLEAAVDGSITAL